MTLSTQEPQFGEFTQTSAFADRCLVIDFVPLPSGKSELHFEQISVVPDLCRYPGLLELYFFELPCGFKRCLLMLNILLADGTYPFVPLVYERGSMAWAAAIQKRLSTIVAAPRASALWDSGSAPSAFTTLTTKQAAERIGVEASQVPQRRILAKQILERHPDTL